MRRNVITAAFLALLLFSTNGVAQTIIPSINQGGILNAASLGADPVNAAAPGSLITIFGTNMATGSAPATSSPLPLNLNGTVVQIGNTFAPLIFVSPNQINAQVPFETLPGTVEVVVWVNDHPSEKASLQVQAGAPGIFTQSQIGVGPAVVFHANGSIVSGNSPAIPGEEVQILCTGLGATLGTQILPTVQTGLPGRGQPTLAVPGVTIGKVTASTTSSVAAPGVGQYIVRAVVPNVPGGAEPLAISISGNTTAADVTINVGSTAPPPPPATGGGGGTGVSGTGPLIFAGGILNAASLDPSSSDTAAPGGLISIFGNNLATTTTGASGSPLPLILSGVVVRIGTVSAPLLLVSPSQINAQVPLEIQPGTTVNVVVTVNGQAGTPEPLKIVPAAPGIFSITGNGSGSASVFHGLDGSLISATSPALPGEEITILTTGLGATISTSGLPATVTGQAGNGQLTVVTPTVTVGIGADGKGGKDARVTYSAAAPGQVGQYLIKAVVPDTGAGDQTFTVTASGNTSRAVSLRIGFLFPQPPAFLQANLAGAFTSSFSLRTTIDCIADCLIIDFAKTVNSPGCTIEVAGTSGPNYTALVHCQDYSDPNNLVAIIVGLKNGQFADNKMVFTQILDTGINHFFYIGDDQTGKFHITADGPITAASVSIDLKRPDFAPGDTVIGTLSVVVSLGASAINNAQSVVVGGGFKDTMTFVQR